MTHYVPCAFVYAPPRWHIAVALQFCQQLICFAIRIHVHVQLQFVNRSCKCLAWWSLGRDVANVCVCISLVVFVSATEGVDFISSFNAAAFAHVEQIRNVWVMYVELLLRSFAGNTIVSERVDVAERRLARLCRLRRRLPKRSGCCFHLGVDCQVRNRGRHLSTISPV